MIRYEVSAVVDPALAGAYEQFMLEHHIPDLLATGCFSRAELSRSAPNHYRASFESADQASLDRYLAEHAPRLRQHFQSRFPSGVTLSREAWTAIGGGDGDPGDRPALTLEAMPDLLAVCRLAPGADLPDWALRPGAFLTLSRTPDELSITGPQEAVPDGVPCERDYRGLRVRGPLPHHLVGILLSIAGPLADAGISIFAVSTYDTDYVLVKAGRFDAAVRTLEKAGHRIIPAAFHRRSKGAT